MFPCPVCRQVANLEASVSMESLTEENWRRNRHAFRRSKSSMIFDEAEHEERRAVIDVAHMRLNEPLSEGPNMDLDIE